MRIIVVGRRVVRRRVAWGGQRGVISEIKGGVRRVRVLVFSNRLLR